MFFDKYPNTDMHELNLDWIIAQIMKLHKDYDEFKAVNTITNAGAWDITRQYQAWTVVSDNNAGYISLQPVPAGVAISNTSYWGLIADYDILITDLSNRISALELAVANINNVKIPELLADEKIFIGDSYGVDATAGGKAWSSYVADVFTSGAYFNCVGGTGFASDLYISQNFLTMLQALSSTVPNKYKVKGIFIFGGANDGNLVFDGTATEQDIVDRIASFCSYAKTTYPNAKVYMSFIGWYDKAHRVTAYNKVINAYKQGALNNTNCVYISGLEPIMRNETYINTGDHIHPTADASATLGEWILKAVDLKSDVHYYKTFTPTLTPASGVNSIYNVSASRYVLYDGNRTRFVCFGTHDNGSNIDIRIDAVNVGYTDSVAIASISNTPWPGSVNPPAQNVTALWHTSDNNNYIGQAQLFIYNGILYVKNLDLNINASNVTQILIFTPIDLTYELAV